MNDLLSQKQKALLTAFCENNNLISMLDISDLKSVVSDKNRKRINSALSEPFLAYPRAENMYYVYSLSNSLKITERYSINMNSKSSCSCKDFFYNSEKDNIDCKHIWRIRLLIKLHCLPDISEQPYLWLRRELFKDILYFDDLPKNTKEYEKEIDNLQQEMMNKHKSEINYIKIMRKRAYIFKKYDKDCHN